MALRELRVSDLSGAELEIDQQAVVTVNDHPALGGNSVELDIGVGEVGQFESKKLNMVSLAIMLPNENQPKRVIMDAAAFDGLFRGDVESVLQAARQAADTGTPKRGRGRPRGSQSRQASQKIDYTDPAHAGAVKRGRISPGEQIAVRENFDAINKRLAQEGQRMISLEDKAMVEKYDLGDLAKERGIKPQ